ncbi:hypothetical protein BLNAU_17720 [Blattamonas nauphoetae]|uniref:Uncharacterized protein n=1 Tax=Blattamonas nauphoetae TaxID=2049346 RepID=A0ABQ9X6B8_9EUKA|nr:hypothetical protein BLNAU_17720 [Blattamonas nauphoetae]
MPLSDSSDSPFTLRDSGITCTWTECEVIHLLNTHFSPLLAHLVGRVFVLDITSRSLIIRPFLISHRLSCLLFSVILTVHSALTEASVTLDLSINISHSLFSSPHVSSFSRHFDPTFYSLLARSSAFISTISSFALSSRHSAVVVGFEDALDSSLLSESFCGVNDITTFGRCSSSLSIFGHFIAEAGSVLFRVLSFSGFRFLVLEVVLVLF